MASLATDLSPENLAGTKKPSSFVEFITRLVKEKPLGAAGGVIALLLLLTGIFADFLAPYGMNETHVVDRLSAPTAQYWLGTDNMGRDILSRVIHGARISVIVGLTASVIATVLNLVIGVVSGYVGGKLDLIVQRSVDAIMCVPSLIVLMVIISVVGAGMWSLIIVLGLLWGVVASRVIRGAVIAIKEGAFVKAAEAIGCSTIRIMAAHILPNIVAPLIILFSIRVPAVIMTEASLSFLGFGIPAPFPSWGGMLSGQARVFMLQAPWMAIWPGLALAIVVYGINMFGDAVRDILDPRMKGGSGSYRVSERRKPKK